jgi:hypothetical protein
MVALSVLSAMVNLGETESTVDITRHASGLKYPAKVAFLRCGWPVHTKPRSDGSVSLIFKSN